MINDSIYFHVSPSIKYATFFTKVDKHITKIQDTTGIDFQHVEDNIVVGPPYKLMGIPFTNAVGSSSGENGLVNLDTFTLGMITKVFPRIARNCGNPWYAVVDHNSLHNMSYALAIHAFGELCDVNKILIITFDTHSDIQSTVTDTIKCTNWVSACLRPKFDRLAKCVVHIGWGKKQGRTDMSGDFSRTNCYLNHDDKQNSRPLNSPFLIKKPDESVQLQIKTVLTTHSSIENVYITVDRDIIKDSCTFYGSGAHDTTIVRKVVKGVMDTLKENDINLKGFDLTGLPNPGYGSGMMMGDMAMEDIEYYSGLVDSYWGAVSKLE